MQTAVTYITTQVPDRYPARLVTHGLASDVALCTSRRASWLSASRPQPRVGWSGGFERRQAARGSAALRPAVPLRSEPVREQVGIKNNRVRQVWSDAPAQVTSASWSPDTR